MISKCQLEDMWGVALNFSSDCKLIACTASDSSVSVWEVATWQPARTLLDEFSGAKTIYFLPHSVLVPFGRQNGNLNVWRVTTHPQFRALQGHSHEVSSVCLSPNSKMLASDDIDGKLIL